MGFSFHGNKIGGNMDEVWFITFQFDIGEGVTSFSTEHACKTAYDEWADYKDAGFEGTKLIEIEGFDDSPSRNYRKIGVDAKVVIQATVGKY